MLVIKSWVHFGVGLNPLTSTPTNNAPRNKLIPIIQISTTQTWIIHKLERERLRLGGALRPKHTQQTRCINVVPFEHCLFVLANTHLRNKETWAYRKQQLQFKQWDHNHTIVLSTLFLLANPSYTSTISPTLDSSNCVSPLPYVAVPLICSFRAHIRYANYTKWLAGTHTKQWTIDHTKWGGHWIQ